MKAARVIVGIFPGDPVGNISKSSRWSILRGAEKPPPQLTRSIPRFAGYRVLAIDLDRRQVYPLCTAINLNSILARTRRFTARSVTMSTKDHYGTSFVIPILPALISFPEILNSWNSSMRRLRRSSARGSWTICFSLEWTRLLPPLPKTMTSWWLIAPRSLGSHHVCIVFGDCRPSNCASANARRYVNVPVFDHDFGSALRRRERRRQYELRLDEISSHTI